MVAELHSRGGDREVGGQGGQRGRQIFKYFLANASVTPLPNQKNFGEQYFSKRGGRFIPFLDTISKILFDVVVVVCFRFWCFLYVRNTF